MCDAIGPNARDKAKRRPEKIVGPTGSVEAMRLGYAISLNGDFSEKLPNSAVTVRLNVDNPENALDPDCTHSHVDAALRRGVGCSARALRRLG